LVIKNCNLTFIQYVWTAVVMLSVMLKHISHVQTAHVRGFRHLLGVTLHSQRTELGN